MWSDRDGTIPLDFAGTHAILAPHRHLSQGEDISPGRFCILHCHFTPLIFNYHTIIPSQKMSLKAVSQGESWI